MPQPSRDRRKKSAQPHRFVAGTDYLYEQLTRMGLSDKSTREKLGLWLPTNRFGPCPSPELLHEWDTDDAAPVLLAWTVGGLRLNVGQLSRLTMALHQRDLGPTLRPGSDMRFWRLPFSFVLELLAG